MLRWVQSGISAVAGTAEPVYGPEALHSIGDTVKGKNPFGELEREDMAWRAYDYTNVETQIFYFTSDSGYITFAQIIFSNVAGIRATAQFTCRVYKRDNPEHSVWTSTALNNFRVENGTDFYADDLSIVLNEAGDEYKILSKVNPETIFDVSVKRYAPGFKIGKDGTTLFGDDIEKPWGSMRHIFWPRNLASGTLTVKGTEVNIKGLCMFVMALQGMKPHHAASTWNFANFQGPNFSAVMMEFVTPPSYGSRKVTVGGIARGDKLLAATIENNAEHENLEVDDVTGWNVPKTIIYKWQGPQIGQDETQIKGEITAKLDTLIERVDVLYEIPLFVKTLISGVVGTKPYIYQYTSETTLDVEIGDESFQEEGTLFNEATFIS